MKNADSIFVSIFVLKMSLLNGEQINDDTLPYGRFMAALKNKINSLYDAFDMLYND